MKKIGFKISSLLFAFALLFSTLSFGMNRRCCNEAPSGKSVFHYVQGCVMQRMDLYDNDNSDSLIIKNIKCCHNVKVQFIKQKALLPTNLKVQKVAVIVDFNTFSFDEVYQQKVFPYQNYTSPFLVKNIPVLVQTFRI